MRNLQWKEKPIVTAGIFALALIVSGSATIHFFEAQSDSSRMLAIYSGVYDDSSSTSDTQNTYPDEPAMPTDYSSGTSGTSETSNTSSDDPEIPTDSSDDVDVMPSSTDTSSNDDLYDEPTLDSDEEAMMDMGGTNGDYLYLNTVDDSDTLLATNESTDESTPTVFPYGDDDLVYDEGDFSYERVGTTSLFESDAYENALGDAGEFSGGNIEDGGFWGTLTDSELVEFKRFLRLLRESESEREFLDSLTPSDRALYRIYRVREQEYWSTRSDDFREEILIYDTHDTQEFADEIELHDGIVTSDFDHNETRGGGTHEEFEDVSYETDVSYEPIEEMALLPTDTSGSIDTIDTEKNRRLVDDTFVEDIEEYRILMDEKTTDLRAYQKIMAEKGDDVSEIDFIDAMHHLDGLRFQRLDEDTELDHTENAVPEMSDETLGEDIDTDLRDGPVDALTLRRPPDTSDLPLKTELTHSEVFRHRSDTVITKDSDEDGINDYDEVVIFKTNPLSARTVPGLLSDADKVRMGIDPTSKTLERIIHELPQESPAPIVGDFQVTHLDVLLPQSPDVSQSRPAVDVAPEPVLQFSGIGLPNSLVTIYIFSTPIIVTVQTDEHGSWTYELDKELDDGTHEMFVATVDNAGKILARSQSIPFVKEAQAAELGTVLSVAPTPDFVGRNDYRSVFLPSAVLIVLIGVLGTLAVVGMRLNRPSGVVSQRNDTENSGEDSHTNV